MEAHHGAVVGLGFLIGRLTYRYPSSHLKYVSADKLASASNLLTEQLVYNNSLIVHAACLSLAEAGRYVRLPLDSKDSGKLETTIEKLMSIAKTSKENRVIEAAITTIGHLALGCVTSSLIDNEKELSPIYDKAINFFYSLPSIFSKNVEVFFTIGEAICTASGGWTSTQMEVFLDIADAEKPTVNEHSDLMKKASGKMLDEILTMATSPLTKKAYCVWLLCMVKFCGKHAVIQVQMFLGLLVCRVELKILCPPPSPHL